MKTCGLGAKLLNVAKTYKCNETHNRIMSIYECNVTLRVIYLNTWKQFHFFGNPWDLDSISVEMMIDTTSSGNVVSVARDGRGGIARRCFSDCDGGGRWVWLCCGWTGRMGVRFGSDSGVSSLRQDDRLNRFQAMDGVNGTPLFKISAHHFWHWNTPSIIIKFCKSFGWLSTLTGRAVTVNPYYLEPVGGPNQGSISSVVPHRERVWHTCHTCRPITSLWRSYKGSIYMLLQKGTTPFLSRPCSKHLSNWRLVAHLTSLARKPLSVMTR